MSGQSNDASKLAVTTNQAFASKLYGIAVPALRGRQETINAALAGGEPSYLRSAFAGQRGAITEGMTEQDRVARAQQSAGSKAALSGGNAMAGVIPANLGAALADALYGSRFAESRANTDQAMNLMGMALGGAGSTGNAALGFGGSQLSAIGMLPNYNQTYANVAGGMAGAASLYGTLNKYGLFDSSLGNPGGTPPVDQWGQAFGLGSPTTAFGPTQSFGLGSVNWKP